MADSGAIARLRDERAVTITRLPVELIEMILTAAGAEFQFPLSMVCWRWYVVLSDWRRRNNLLLRTPMSVAVHSIPLLDWSSATFASSASHKKVTYKQSHENTVTKHAAATGKLEVLQYAQSQGYAFREGIVYSQAAGNGHLHIMNWAYKNQYKLTAGTLESAAKNGQMAVLTWLVARNCPYDEEALYYAARSGNLEVLQFVYDNCGACIFYSLHCEMAATHGWLHILQWLHQHACPWDYSTTIAAAGNGHLEVLQWARANRCPWNAWTCSAAAQGGHLEILKWLRTNGCPWDTLTCAEAARGGHLEVLKWARAQDCPWDRMTRQLAALYSHAEVLEWARDNGCPE